MAGSLDALVDLLIPTTTTYPERSYVFAFILCSRLFLRPYELLTRVVQVGGRGVAWASNYFVTVDIPISTEAA